MSSDFYAEYKINDHIRLTVIDIKDIDEKLRNLLDTYMVQICEGNSETPLTVVKRRIVELFSNKKEDWKMGAIAEFFVHLYLKLNGYKQECLYLNLEENSIKKGFDGYYSLNGKEWIMESKAGAVSSANITHSAKVQLAMRDLEQKVSGKDAKNGMRVNNPWQEAYSHACHIDVCTAENIRKNIKKLANEYTMGLYHSIDEFNTMPSGTIFLKGNWIQYDHDDIKNSINQLGDLLKGRHVHVLCMTQRSTQLFMKYITDEV